MVGEMKVQMLSDIYEQGMSAEVGNTVAFLFFFKRLNFFDAHTV